MKSKTDTPIDKTPNLLGDKFVEEIQSLVKTHALSYMDAVIHWCEKKNIEFDVGAELVSKSAIIKGMIQKEAEELNLMRKSNRLF